jgi:uncharacterized protein (DUF4415 family)
MRLKLRRNTLEEEAAIQRGIAADPDAPEWTDADFAAARPAAEVMPPEFTAAHERRKRGRQRKPTKVLVSIRLDRDVVEQLRQSGEGWQSRANDLLRKAVLPG